LPPLGIFMFRCACAWAWALVIISKKRRAWFLGGDQQGGQAY